MNNKRYFDKFTIGFTIFFIIVGIVFLVGKFSKKLLVNSGLMDSGASEEVISESQVIETFASVIFSMLVIYSIICFYKFMRKANQGMLFSETSSHLWKRISTVFIIIGVLAGLLCILDFKYIGLIPVCAFLSSIAFSFSKIFKDSSILKSENDLTI